METSLQVTQQRARFEELIGTCGRDCVRLAFLMTGNRAEAEDIAQEAFVRVLGRFGNLRNPDAFRAYLMRTVVNLSKSHFRHQAVEQRHAWRTANQEAVLPNHRLEDRDLLFRTLRTLPRRQRAAVVLRYCEDLSEQQTAEILQTSVKAVKSLVTRGLATLREHKEMQT